MELSSLIAETEVLEHSGDPDAAITELAYSSDAVTSGSLFFCVPGFTADGHEFASEAVERGAVALCVERLLDLPVAQVRVPSVRRAMAPIAAAFYGDPTADLTVVGITGTNGKTTTAFLLHAILEAAGRRTGLLGTVKRVVGGRQEDVVRTTPEAIDLQAAFARMREAGDEACVMEVSSHALALGRADAIHFDAGVFTNLTQDHLDFHPDMEAYFAAKALLFESGPPVAVVNVDDPYGRRLAERRPCTTVSPSGHAAADFRAEHVSFGARGARFRCIARGATVHVELTLPGAFNVENALCALAVAVELGVDLQGAATALARAEPAPGRMEPVEEGQPFLVLVDYAHTPDSLENVLRAARDLAEGRLICVFGCGGDRDRGKRPLMGRAAAALADVAIVTSDNPRSEDPGAIIAAILEGMEGDPVVEPDRATAIGRAIRAARRGDVVIIAGKGHEQGQELAGGRTIPFDDREAARDALRALTAGAATGDGA